MKSTPHDTPFGTCVPLGRYLGIPVSAHWSVLIILALLASTLATQQLPAAHPGEPAGSYWLAAVVTALVFLVCLELHELAHAALARHFGMRVERMTLWMLGGLTELVDEPPTPRADALIAAAGPATSLALGAVFAALARGLDHTLVASALGWLAAVNVLLAVFNLLPGAPLDGGRVLRALLWWRYHDRQRAVVASSRAGRVLGAVLMALGVLQLVGTGSVSGLWLVLVGWFIGSAAGSERYAAAFERLGALRVADVMRRHPVAALHWWTVEEFLARLDLTHAGQSTFPVVDVEGRAVGAFTIRDIGRLSADRRAATTIGELSSRAAPPLLVADGTLVKDVLPRLHGQVVTVVDGSGRPVGTVDASDLARAARLLQLRGSGLTPGQLTR